MRISAAERTLNYAILTFFALLAVLPLVGVLITSLTPPGEGGASLGVPSRLSFGNYAQAWTTGHFSQYMMSSTIVVVCVVVGTAVLAILAGFGFARLRFPGSNIIFYACILGLMVPQEAYVVPLYFTFRDLGLDNSYLAVILPQIAQSLAFGIFWMRAAFRALPESLLQAARLDGASNRVVLWRILVPPTMPAVLTMVMLVFMWTWNEFLLSLVMLRSESLRTAPLALTFFQSRFTTNFPVMAAAASIIALPVVILYIFLQRHFLRGMLSGAIKG